MIAMLFATVAFSIDSMLPALPEIARELTPDNPNHAQLILTSFVLGMGFGTLVAGPLSDAFGRKPVILVGAVLYCAASLWALVAPGIEGVLIARVLQGIGAAGPRVVTLALVRDLYKGREMARVVSFAMMIFTLVPAVAPLAGSVIIDIWGWRSVFLAFILFAIAGIGWVMLRQPETLAPPARLPLSPASLRNALSEVMGNRQVVISIAVQTMCFGALFGALSSTQQVFDQYFDRAGSFPFWFALIALMSASASVINAALVVRLGMRRIVTMTLLVQVCLSLGFGLLVLSGLVGMATVFALYIGWTTTVFMVAGLTLGNLNALAMEPLGHIAGMAASISGSIATVLAVALAVPIGLAFDGTPVPLAFGVFVLTLLAALLMRLMPKHSGQDGAAV